MDNLDLYKWSIIYTDHNNNFIHSDHIYKSNPDSQVILANTSNNYNKDFAWRNGDLLFRTWLYTNIDKIKYNNIAILEWDVVLTTTLPSTRITGLMGKNVIYYETDPSWYWFKDVNLLEPYKKYSSAISPFGVLFIDKSSLLILLDKEFDHLYSHDINCEVRLPTIMASKNIPLNAFPLPHVDWRPVEYLNMPGIYHPIKYNVN